MVQMKFAIEGPADEITPLMEVVLRTMKEARMKSSVQAFASPDTSEAKFKPGEDGYYIQMVWSKITSKAKRALLYIANHNHCTKEEIVRGVDQLSDTRDLGGALSSVSRRCKALWFDINVVFEVYGKVDTAHGPRYVMAEAVAEAIKKLGEHIDDNEPIDVVEGDPDDE